MMYLKPKVPVLLSIKRQKSKKEGFFWGLQKPLSLFVGEDLKQTFLDSVS